MDAAMLRDLIVSLITSELKKELSNIFTENRHVLATDDASINTPNSPRGNNTMIDTAGPLWFSPKEQRLIDYLTEHGPAKQAQIVKHFKDHANPINDTTVKELLANLGFRRVISSGPDGYEVKR